MGQLGSVRVASSQGEVPSSIAPHPSRMNATMLEGRGGEVAMWMPLSIDHPSRSAQNDRTEDLASRDLTRRSSSI